MIALLAGLLPLDPAQGAAPLGGAEVPVQVTVDIGRRGKPLRHLWPYFGYDECNLTTTPAAKDLMRTLAEIQPEPVYLRQHFLLASDDGPPGLKWGSTNVYSVDPAGSPSYDWRTLDAIFDSILGSGCRPLVEIGFMPRDLSARPEPYRPRSPFELRGGVFQPPRDFERWSELIRAWAGHSKERYGSVEGCWLWELWNEPNIPYWQGTFEEYCRLFDVTERALHEVLPKAALGGPHTAGMRDDFLRRFLDHCLNGTNAVTGARGTRLDYVGFHAKGGTGVVEGHPRMDLGLNLLNIRHEFAAIASFPELLDTPVIIGECDPEGAAALSARVQPANGYRNGCAYAAYETALMKHAMDLAERLDVRLQGVLTWAFLFDGKDSFEGFRTLSTNGIHKAVLNAFKLLGMLQGDRVPVESSGALGADRIIQARVRASPDVDGLATASEKSVQVLLWHYHDDVAPAAPIEVRLRVLLSAVEARRARVTHYRIDETHSNAHRAWIEMGRPARPTAEERDKLRAAAALELLEPVRFHDVHDGALELSFPMPRHAVSMIEVRPWP